MFFKYNLFCTNITNMNKYYRIKNISISIFILIIVYLVLFNITKKLNKIFKKFTKDILSLLAI